MASMAIATSYLQLNSSVLKAMTMANKVAYIKVAKGCTSSQTALHRNCLTIAAGGDEPENERTPDLLP